ncbi:chemotaxis protein CheW [Aliikangiella maris]|uniref:Chemotaxis protein CheA n=2 Tax=Aliikangiella maris TaxID=3162458 RepID=A0ABV2BS60_9GAMM
MSFEADEEILQDFLIEAGEILEAMSEQLVALENEPEDMDLLNGIFRGFHTVKGGAGFLALEPLVEICHITENIFDILRNGERVADADLMDHILQALDIVNEMFEDVRNGEYPTNANPDFLAKLGTYAVAASKSAPPPASQSAPSDDITEDEFNSLIEETVASDSAIEEATDEDIGADEITDDEFDALLDELHGAGQFSVDKLAGGESDTSENDQVESEQSVEPANQQSEFDDFADFSAPASTDVDSQKATSDDITDEEFEALLDELHGKGAPISAAENKQAPPVTHDTVNDSEKEDSDLIDEDEFEALLDELHGVGAGPSKNTVTSGSQAGASPAPATGQSTNKSKPANTYQPAASPPPPPPRSSIGGDEKIVAKKPSARKANSNTVTEATVRVDTKRLDEIMNMVGELVLARNRLKTLGQANPDEDLTKAIANLDIVTADLQGAVMKTRMQPIKKVFGRFPRVVRDLARSLKKEISLEMVGEETDLDKNLVEALADPLVHLVRNSVDHGIESPEERVAVGKPRSGKIILSAAQEGDHIMLAIQDDGKGMNANLLRNIAVEKGLMDREQADRLTNTECYNLIFMAGFSTKKEISDISGRGVGMDVVKTKITQLNGTLTIDSTMGVGTKIMIKVPLTLAILPTLMVKVKEQTFALPLTSVNEIFHLDLTKTNIVDGQLVIVVRDKALPLFFLNEWLTRSPEPGKRDRKGHVVLVQVGTQRVGFVVDSLIGQEEVVIKPLGKSLHGTPGMAGATITSDGGIALIIDIPTLLKHYAG